MVSKKNNKITIRVHKNFWRTFSKKRMENYEVYKTYQRHLRTKDMFFLSDFIEKLIKKDSRLNIKKDQRKIITTSLSFKDPSLWKLVTNYCKTQGITITKYLEDLITQNLN